MTDAPADRCPADGSWEVEGNHLSLLVDGPERLKALIRLVDGARTSLRLLFYIYAPDRSGTQVRDALGRAAARGVTVTLIIDAFGSSADDAFFAPLTRAGATVCRFHPRFGRRYLLRNHQKLALADEARAMIGGFNIEDDYFGTVDARAWRDLGLLVEGPAAARLAGYYDALAAWTQGRRVRSRPLRTALDRWSETEGRARWLLGGPARRLSPWADSVRRDMRRASRLDMIAAYFAPNPRMMRTLERISRRGGAARVLTAGKSDNTATIGAARHCYGRLLRRGVRMFEYQPTKLHTKLFVIDDIAYVGSANFDMRSLYLNLELMLRVEDAGFAAGLRTYCERELSQSREVTRIAYRRRGIVDRVRWAIAYFVVAVVDYGVTRRLNFGIAADDTLI